MSTQSKVILGILGAAAAGVAIGLLLAPEKGSDLRKRLKKTTGGWADSLGHLFAKATDEMEDLKGNSKRNKDMPAGA